MKNSSKIKSVSVLKNIISVSVSNLVKLFSGVLVGFLLPKMIGVSDYGYYKTFTLYASYVGVFGIGIIDGIYLKYGGKQYDELDKEKFRLFTRVIIFLQFFIGILGICIASSFTNLEIRFIFIAISIYLVSGNITGYYQIISQITGRFKELSYRNIIYSLYTAFSILLLYFFQICFSFKINYQIYVILYVVIFVILSLWYSFTYREITFGKAKRFDESKYEIINFVKIGIPLLIANLCATFILTLDRQFVNVLFDNETYAIYAFAYNMLALVTTATGAISTVIYPTLKQKKINELFHQYCKLVNIILVLSFICMLGFYPLCWFVDAFLPQYHNSLIIFRIIFPGLALSSVITIVIHNYYKAIGENLRYFIYSVFILVLSVIANYFSYLLFRSPESISIASVIMLLVWYLVVENYLRKTYHVKSFRNLTYMFVMIASFYIITNISNYYIGFIFIVLSFIVITILYNQKYFIKKIRK